MSLRINHIFADPVSSLHQSIQVFSRRVHLYPSRVVFLALCLGEANCLQSSLFVNLLVTPDAICPHVCAVEVRFCGIEYHTVDSRLVAVLVVLDILLERSIAVDVEDVSIAGILVEGVAVDVVRWLSRGKEEDGACLGVCLLCLCCRGMSPIECAIERSIYHVHQSQSCLCVQSRWGCRPYDCSISSCSRRRCSSSDAVVPIHVSHMTFAQLEKARSGGTYVKGHPANWFIVRNLRLFDQLQRQLLVVESNRDDDPGLHPCPNHKMMLAHLSVESARKTDGRAKDGTSDFFRPMAHRPLFWRPPVPKPRGGAGTVMYTKLVGGGG